MFWYNIPSSTSDAFALELELELEDSGASLTGVSLTIGASIVDSLDMLELSPSFIFSASITGSSTGFTSSTIALSSSAGAGAGSTAGSGSGSGSFCAVVSMVTFFLLMVSSSSAVIVTSSNSSAAGTSISDKS